MLFTFNSTPRSFHDVSPAAACVRMACRARSWALCSCMRLGLAATALLRGFPTTTVTTSGTTGDCAPAAACIASNIHVCVVCCSKAGRYYRVVQLADILGLSGYAERLALRGPILCVSSCSGNQQGLGRPNQVEPSTDLIWLIPNSSAWLHCLPIFDDQIRPLALHAPFLVLPASCCEL